MVIYYKDTNLTYTWLTTTKATDTALKDNTHNLKTEK